MNTKQDIWRKRFEFVTLMGFILIIGIPGLAIMLGSKGQLIEGEKRKLATLPALPGNWKETQEFPGKLESYFADAHPWRATLTKIAAKTWREGFGQPFTSNVLLGRDGWMFYNPTRRASYYRGEEPIESWTLAVWKRRQESTHEWLKERGVPYLFVMVPDKHFVYPEHLPAHLRPRRDRPAEIISYLQEHIPDLAILDLPSVLRSSKNLGYLYYRTDTHWNDQGARVAYEAILERLREMKIPVGNPIALTNYREETATYAGDLAGLSLLQDRESEKVVFLRAIQPEFIVKQESLPNQPGFSAPPQERRIATEHANNRLPRAWIIRDSFGSALIPWLGNHFHRAIWHWQSAFSFQGLDVNSDRPNIVIHEASERMLWYLGRPHWAPELEESWASRRFATMQPLIRISPDNWHNQTHQQVIDNRVLRLTRKQTNAKLSLRIQGPIGPKQGLVVVRLEWNHKHQPTQVEILAESIPNTDTRLAVANRQLPANVNVAHMVLEHANLSRNLSISFEGTSMSQETPPSIELRFAPNE